MESIYMDAAQFLLEIIVFLILMIILEFAYKKLENKQSRLLNPGEYFPEDEVHSLKQVYYLIIIALCFINIMYSLTFTESDVLYLAIFDIVLSLYLAMKLDKSSSLNKILVILLIPYGSLTYIIFGNSLVGFLDFIHVPVFVYIMKLYFDKFREYTETNGLGIAIILLFIIIFFSFLWTQFFENVNALDSLVMVSNAFTSNGYTVLGNTIAGKFNSVLLVWSGYILSGVGTATLTAGILIRHFNSRFEELENLIKENNED